MTKVTSVFSLWIVLQVFVAGVVQAQAELYKGYEHLFTTPLSYAVYRTIDSIEVDGKAGEVSWQKAHWSESFTDIEGDRKLPPAMSTRFKMLWNENYLYIFAEMEEKHVWASLREHDQVVFYDNDFEVFIDPNGDSQTYFEIEVNAFNTVFDLFLPKAYRDGGAALIPWNASGLKSAVSVKGTLNDPGDEDESWSIEMAIPFRDVNLGNIVHVPRNGDHWRINFSRVEWDVDIIDAKYQKRIDSLTGKNLPEHNWVWSPQGVVNMHYPERWGYAWFSSNPVDNAGEMFPLPSESGIRDFLWLLYYKQREYRNKNGSYADRHTALGLVKPSVSINNVTYSISCYGTGQRFVITLRDTTTQRLWQITDQGTISTSNNQRKNKRTK